MPLANDSGLVAVLAEELGNGDLGFRKVSEAPGTAADETINSGPVGHAPRQGGGSGG